MIELKYCTIEKMPWGSTIRFPDGSESSNWPLDDAYYAWVAEATGHGDDLTGYCFEHEFCHVFLPEALFDKRSYVVWQSAHGLEIDETASYWEERLVFYFQQYLHDLVDLSHDPQMIAAREKALKYLS